MAGMKDSWKQTGSGLGHAFRDLGKTLIKTGKKGVDSAVDWANSSPQENQIPETVDSAETAVAEIAANTTGETSEDTTAAEQNSVADEIQKLAQLKEKGYLTEEEFEAKKKQLLGLL